MGESVQMQTEQLLKEQNEQNLEKEIVLLKKQLLSCQRMYVQSQMQLLTLQNEKLDFLEKSLEESK